jgi:short-subunit dehydrogenase
MTHVAITGASSGIGEAMVREWVKAGAQVTMVARRRELMEKIAIDVGGKTHIAAADLSDPARSTEWIADAEKEFGPIDVLVNNAGMQIVEAAAVTDQEQADMLLRLDLLVPMRLTRAVLPQMLARKHGTIVDVASLAGLAPTPFMYWYNAAKGGLGVASEGLRGELRKSGVHVVTVYPGPVDTPMARTAYATFEPSLGIKLLPAGTTDVLARRVRRAVERRRARVIYPWFYTVARHFPALTRFLIDRSTLKLARPQDKP